MGIKGYVVRWVGSGDGKRWCDSPGEAAAEAWGRSLSDRCSDVAIFRVHDDGREERLPSYEEALGALSILREEVQAAQDKRGGMSCGGPPLLWTCPPSTLKELLRLADGAPVGDPLAELEAAERRLLEAGGWRPDTLAAGFGVERWARGHEVESRTVALTIERRRLAAKGGV